MVLFMLHPMYPWWLPIPYFVKSWLASTSLKVLHHWNYNFAPIEMIIWLSYFILLSAVLHLLTCVCWSIFFILEINPTWTWYMIILLCSWIQFASILLRISASMFISDIGLEDLFIVAVCKSQNSQQGREARSWSITESYTICKVLSVH